MTHLRNDMSENDLSHIDMVADSVGSDTCEYLWVLRVCFSLIFHEDSLTVTEWKFLSLTINNISKPIRTI